MLNFWAFTLLDFDFDVVHRPGFLMVLEDSLSRLFPASFWGEGGLAPPQVPEESKVSHKKKLRISLLAVSDEIPNVNRELAVFIQERLNKRDPGSHQSQRSILEDIHKRGHFGAESLFQQAWMAGFYWKTMRADCENLVKQCQSCLKHNVARMGFHPLTTIAATYPFDHVAVDLFGPLPMSESGSTYTLIVVDIATRFCVLRTLSDKTANSVAQALYSVFMDFGVPKILQSDNGGEFANAVLDSLLELLGSEHRSISPYHPRANGAAESHVKLCKKLLFKLTAGDMQHWDQYLPSVQLSINLRIPKRHRSTPFALMFGRPFNPSWSSSNPGSSILSEKDLEKRHHTMRNIVFPAIREITDSYNQRMVKKHDKRQKILSTPIPPGTQVMIKNDSGITHETPFVGPFFVVRKSKGGAYQLRDSLGNLLPRDLPPSKLKIIGTNNLPDGTSYEVEAIVNHRGHGSGIEYFVKWKDYPDSQNTWEPPSSFDTDRPILKYWARKRRTPPV
jgi:transposase InsO family protein